MLCADTAECNSVCSNIKNALCSARECECEQKGTCSGGDVGKKFYVTLPSGVSPGNNYCLTLVEQLDDITNCQIGTFDFVPGTRSGPALSSGDDNLVKLIGLSVGGFTLAVVIILLGYWMYTKWSRTSEDDGISSSCGNDESSMSTYGFIRSEDAIKAFREMSDSATQTMPVEVEQQRLVDEFFAEFP